MRKLRPHGAVISWFQSYPLDEFALPSLALFEMQVGVELTRQRDADKAKEIEAWMDRVAKQVQVLPLDGASARVAAKWLHGKSTELTEDAMIAAIGSTHGLTVATRNLRDFQQFPVALINPYI